MIHIPQSQLNIKPSTQDFDDIEDHRQPAASPMSNTLNALPEHTTGRSSWLRQIGLWLLLSGGIALFGGMAFDLVSKYLDSYDKAPWVSVGLLGANALFLLLILWLVLRESLAYWRVSALVADRQQIGELVLRAQKDEVTDLIDQLDQRMEDNSLSALLHQRFWASVQAHHTGQERLTIYRTLVADPLREQAESLIQPAVLQGAGISLISPSNSIHTLILLWRSAKLVRDIAHIYGIRPGFFGNLTLLKVTLENAILQQGADLLIDAGVSKLSQGVLSLVAEKGAEATVTGLLIRRIAKATIDELDVTRLRA